MHNYANFLNLMTTGFYIPASFAYILPMIKWGSLITPEQRAVPTRDFAVMGFLDCLAGIDTHALPITEARPPHEPNPEARQSVWCL